MYTINITFEEKGVSPVKLENIDYGVSLLEVLLDNKLLSTTK